MRHQLAHVDAKGKPPKNRRRTKRTWLWRTLDCQPFKSNELEGPLDNPKNSPTAKRTTARPRLAQRPNEVLPAEPVGPVAVVLLALFSTSGVTREVDDMVFGVDDFGVLFRCIRPQRTKAHAEARTLKNSGSKRAVALENLRARIGGFFWCHRSPSSPAALLRASELKSFGKCIR